MNNEFKKIKSNNETRYVLETASAGATSSGSIASVPGGVGKVQKRNPDNILAQEGDKDKVPGNKPRNFVAKNAKMGGAGQHRDKKKEQKQGKEKHKKPYMEDLKTRLAELKARLAEMQEGASDYVGNAIEDLRASKPGLDRESFLDELYFYIDAQYGKQAADSAFASEDDDMFDEWYASYTDIAEENPQHSHQYKTTMKHADNPTVQQRMAAHDIKPGIAGYRDRVDLLKDLERTGKLKKEEQGYDEVSPKSASYILRKLDQGVPMSSILDDFPELGRMMEIIAGERGLHPDDDFEQIEDILMNDLEDIAAQEDDFGDYDHDEEQPDEYMESLSQYLQSALNEKAVSKAQQRFMGMVHAAQKGEKAASPEVAKVAKGMGKKDAKDFASTKHKGLPEKKKSKK